MEQSNGAVVAYRDVDNRLQEYRARLKLPQPASIDRILMRHMSGPDVTIQAATLFDERTDMFLAITPSDRGRFQRVHSGDVKIYENMDVLPRAYMVHEVVPAADAEQSLSQVRAMLADGDYVPGQAAVVEGGYPLTTRSKSPQSVHMAMRHTSGRIQTIGSR